MSDLSDLSDSLTVSHLSWATWAIRSQSLICPKQSDQIAHSRSFDMSNLSKWANSQPWCWPSPWLCGHCVGIVVDITDMCQNSCWLCGNFWKTLNSYIVLRNNQVKKYLGVFTCPLPNSMLTAQCSAIFLNCQTILYDNSDVWKAIS